MNMFRIILLLLATIIVANAQEDLSGIRGLIQSCSGWALNRLPQLKSFLKEENGVDQYKNVEVQFISGRKAVLTIFNDGKEQEKITLSDYNDKDKLHALFAEKGFQQYTKEEMIERRKMKAAPLTMKEAEGRLRKASELPKGYSSSPVLSPKLRKQEIKEKLRKLKEARENFMVVGAPRN